MVGTPIYECEGCSGPEYSSAIVVAKDRMEISSLEDLRGLVPAVNDLNSCSGHLLLAWQLGPKLFADVPRLHMTGSHHASMLAVGNGQVGSTDYVKCMILRYVHS